MPQPFSVMAWVAGVACAMALLLLGLLSAAARRTQQARETLAATRQAQAASAEQAQAAQALLHQIFDHAGQGITVFDADLRLRAWNALTLSNTGLDAALARVGLPLREALLSLARGGEFGAVDPEAEADRRLAILTGQAASVTRHIRPDGSCIETRSNPLPDGGLVLMHVDITEREASQAVLAQQQRKLALVLENTEQGFWTCDNALRTTDANPAMCRLLGISRAQMLGRSIYDFVDEANAEIFQRHVRQRAQGQAEGYEIALRRADGTLVHCFNNATPVFDDRGRKTGAVGLYSDISAQKRAEQQIRQAGERLAQKSQELAATLDNLVQGVLSVDTQDRCNTWNRRFIELLQLPESLMQGRPTLEALRQYQTARGDFGERLDAAGQQHLRSFVEGDTRNMAARYQRARADGLVLEVASHFAADGSLVRTFTDVTATVQAQQALRAAKDEAEQAREEAERANRAKSDFLSRMSHELRTPMNAILGFGQLLEADSDEPLSPIQRQRVTEMLRGGHHLLVLINEVLDIARIEAGTLQLVLQPVDAIALARDCLSLVQPVAQARGVSLVLVEPGPADDANADADTHAHVHSHANTHPHSHADSHADTLLVQADATRLRQVLLNLLSNAIKFNRLAGKVRLSCRAEDSAVLIEVADQGPGIAPEQLPKLFQAFERLDVDGAIEGAGIGLALSRSLSC